MSPCCLLGPRRVREGGGEARACRGPGPPRILTSPVHVPGTQSSVRRTADCTVQSTWETPRGSLHFPRPPPHSEGTRGGIAVLLDAQGKLCAMEKEIMLARAFESRQYGHRIVDDPTRMITTLDPTLWL